MTENGAILEEMTPCCCCPARGLPKAVLEQHLSQGKLGSSLKD